ncbi:hypothetical protein SAMD00019534_113510 [Acytostelium subglobosum LB1]|uniref:hypothetical protein n=1 Tax=Acytostelium subglobosum LB1 TaxID=1410327 RepID=UPI00064521D7|nr:hypothetical protein SAMD00019534_113510 [Acytostelium subglobosum LB1]GAM28175.1 hypothetical protein SAMD00019534_113510 [Acytostelium subglobosum LB1]|eukprot:XP_012748809.1 hypothetical protein SAMD00019534_113510 [Acytostelium subglobosum LB1]
MSSTSFPNGETISRFINSVQHCCDEITKPDSLFVADSNSNKAFYLSLLNRWLAKFSKLVPADGYFEADADGADVVDLEVYVPPTLVRARIETAKMERNRAESEVVINNAFFDSVGMKKVPGVCSGCNEDFGQNPRKKTEYPGEDFRFHKACYKAAKKEALDRHLTSLEMAGEIAKEMAKEMANRQQRRSKIAKVMVDEDDKGGPSNIAKIVRAKPVDVEDEPPAKPIKMGRVVEELPAKPAKAKVVEEEPPAKPSKPAKAKVVEEEPAKVTKTKHQEPPASPPASKGKGKK